MRIATYLLLSAFLAACGSKHIPHTPRAVCAANEVAPRDPLAIEIEAIGVGLRLPNAKWGVEVGYDPALPGQGQVVLTHADRGKILVAFRHREAVPIEEATQMHDALVTQGYAGLEDVRTSVMDGHPRAEFDAEATLENGTVMSTRVIIVRLKPDGLTAGIVINGIKQTSIQAREDAERVIASFRPL